MGRWLELEERRLSRGGLHAIQSPGAYSSLDHRKRDIHITQSTKPFYFLDIIQLKTDCLMLYT
jgi:hypothetical protein